MSQEKKFQLLYVDNFVVADALRELVQMAEIKIIIARSLPVVLKKLIRAGRVDGIIVHDLDINQINELLAPIIGLIPILVVKRFAQGPELKAAYLELENKGVETITRKDFLNRGERTVIEYFAQRARIVNSQPR